MLFNARHAIIATLVALAAMVPGAFAAPVPTASPVEGNRTDPQQGTSVGARGYKPWPPKYYCMINGPQPGCN